MSNRIARAWGPAKNFHGEAFGLVAAMLLTSGVALAGPASTSILTVADFNADGISDLLAEKIANGDEGVLWIMLIDGTDPTSLLAEEYPFQLQEGYEFLGVGNFNANQEGQSHIAARKTSGSPANEVGGIRLWDLTSDASAVDGTAEGTLVAIPDAEYSLVGISDMDGNGTDDFVFIHEYDGSEYEGLIRVYLMAGLNTVETITHPMVIPDPGTRPDLEVLGVGDVTGDGIGDIVIADVEDTVGADEGKRFLRVLKMRPSVGGDPTDGIVVDEQLFAWLAAPADPAASLDYDFAGFALIDDDSRADMIFVKSDSPNQGLVRVHLMPAITEGVAENLDAVTFHPVNLGTDFDYLGSGLVDSDIETDLVLTRNSGDADGQVEAVLLEINGTLLATDHVDEINGPAFPVRIDPAEWDERTTGPVTIP